MANWKQIRNNEGLADDMLIDSSENVEIAAGDADYGDAAFNRMPVDNVGFLPENQRNKKR